MTAPCLRRRARVRILILAMLLGIAAIYVLLAARHPVRYARYLAARAIRRIPRAEPDGEPLDRREMRAFAGIIDASRRTASAEGSRT